MVAFIDDFTESKQNIDGCYCFKKNRVLEITTFISLFTIKLTDILHPEIEMFNNLSNVGILFNFGFSKDCSVYCMLYSSWV